MDEITIKMSKGTAKLLLSAILLSSILITGIFLSPTVRAPSFVTIPYTYDSSTQTASFNANILGINHTLGSITLLNSVCTSPVGINNCYADIQFSTPFSFTGISVLGNSIPDVVNSSLSFNIVKGSISNYTFVTWQTVQDRADNITDMNTTCSDPNNIRSCTGNPIGWHWHNTTKTIEVPLFSNPSLALQNGKFRIYGTIPNNANVDWIANFFGLTIPQFAWWNTSWSQYDNYTVTPKNAVWDVWIFNTTCGAQFNSSLDCKDIRFLSPTNVQFPAFLYSNSSFNSTASNATFFVNISGYSGISSLTVSVYRNNSGANAGSQNFNICSVEYLTHTASINDTCGGGITNDFGAPTKFDANSNTFIIQGTSGVSAPIQGNFTFNYVRFSFELNPNSSSTSNEPDGVLNNNTLNNPCTNCRGYQADVDYGGASANSHSYYRMDGGFFSLNIITNNRNSSTTNSYDNDTVTRDGSTFSYFYSNSTVSNIFMGNSSDSLYNQTGFTRIGFMNGRAGTYTVYNATLMPWNGSFVSSAFSQTVMFVAATIAFSGNSSISPATYSSPTTNATIVWKNSTNPFSLALLELNYTGAATNYTMLVSAQNTTHSTAIYNLTFGAGVTSYRFFANDSANTQNSTALLTLSIASNNTNYPSLLGNATTVTNNTYWLNNTLVNFTVTTNATDSNSQLFANFTGNLTQFNRTSPAQANILVYNTSTVTWNVTICSFNSNSQINYTQNCLYYVLGVDTASPALGGLDPANQASAPFGTTTQTFKVNISDNVAVNTSSVTFQLDSINYTAGITNSSGVWAITLTSINAGTHTLLWYAGDNALPNGNQGSITGTWSNPASGAGGSGGGGGGGGGGTCVVFPADGICNTVCENFQNDPADCNATSAVIPVAGAPSPQLSGAPLAYIGVIFMSIVIYTAYKATYGKKHLKRREI